MQKITHLETSAKKDIVIELVSEEDFKSITKAKYFFDWKKEKENLIYKLRIDGADEILGLMAIKHFEQEERCEIKLLSVSKENRGQNKKYKDIAENLIAFACREAVKNYAENACVSLFPKTELKSHYIEKYGMLDAGKQVFLEGISLFRLLKKNEL
ncbi:N-acetyltransferase [Flavobacterium undicola]|uniref:N-acetyltransferase n=1 Tax=Flavobacterium undicola TaxID=1932779 RepID=UPI001378CFAB|nr:N-acetyltransferase [Flavobacterium undicola]MBA0882407.1 N-acetyltransferase [Flavobacterium undicola]